MSFAHPEYLISAEALAEKLGNDNLRLFDAAIYLTPNPKGGFMVEPGQAAYDKAHIPGAAFLDQIAQLSDRSSQLGFTRLADAALIQAFADAGIGADSDVVFYSSGATMWATRAWWLLHYCGHENVAVLDGGLRAWQDAGLDCSTEPATYAAAEWRSSVLPQHFADKQAVAAAMEDAGVCTINALSPGVYDGSDPHHYGRRGHIPGSVNIFYNALLEKEKFRKPAELKQALADVGALNSGRVITYCGGGIAATVDAFACLLAGKEDVAVYDGSMSEWVRDETLPLVEGSAP